jgi:hypothetical protein
MGWVNSSAKRFSNLLVGAFAAILFSMGYEQVIDQLSNCFHDTLFWVFRKDFDNLQSLSKIMLSVNLLFVESLSAQAPTTAAKQTVGVWAFLATG